MEKDKKINAKPKRVIALFSSIAFKRQRQVTPIPIPRDTHLKIVIIRSLYTINSPINIIFIIKYMLKSLK